jgi:hypothetical protein
VTISTFARVAVSLGFFVSFDVSASQGAQSFQCAQPLPEFTLGEQSQPTDDQVAALCACIWNEFPEKGWERRTSTLIRAGEDGGWRARPFMARFFAALESCGGMEL